MKFLYFPRRFYYVEIIFNEILFLTGRDKKIINFVWWVENVRFINLSDKLLEIYINHTGLITGVMNLFEVTHFVPKKSMYK
uniref:Uncharacterized protein n=1 Tax=Manihot esculenta TaxID=3983 RepID=A0A2C9WGY3_MANES